MPEKMLDIAFREAFKDENEEDIQLAQDFIKRARERDKRAGGKVDDKSDK